MTQHIDFKLLEKSWQGVCQSLNLTMEHHLAQTTYQTLIKHYDQPTRAYHNLQHLCECLTHLYAYPESSSNFDHIEIALWFHDAIYNPQSTNNECDSADWAMQFLTQCGADQVKIQAIENLIMATQSHHAQTDNEKIMLDIDLLILASAVERFEEYQQQIRTEYDFVPDEVFNDKRQQVLRGFYQRPRIYQTSYFYQHYENQARANLKQALKQLN